MAEAAVAGQFFCHSCSQHFGSSSQDLVCPHCESGFVEKVDNTSNNTSPDVDVVHTAGGAPSALDMLRGSLMHYWPSSEFAMGGTYDDPSEGVSFFQINIQPSTSTSGPSSSTAAGQSSSNDASRAFGGGARPRNMPERYNLRQRSRPSPTNRTNGSAGTSQSPRAPEEVNSVLLEGFLQQLLSGTQPALMFGSTATVQGQGANAGPATPPWGMFALHGNPGDYAWGANGLDNVITQLLGQLDSSGAPPATKETIDTLPTVEISREHTESKKECSVCMETFVSKDTAKKLPCAHMFHIPCIDNWLRLHNTCPICRKNVERCLPGASSSGVYYPNSQQ